MPPYHLMTPHLLTPLSYPDKKLQSDKAAKKVSNGTTQVTILSQSANKIEYITREQGENRNNISKIAQTTHSSKSDDNDSNGII